MASTPADDILQRIQDLCPELQETIFDYTLTPQTNVVVITKDYQPPSQLSINRKTREASAKAYYGDTTFLIDGPESGRPYAIGLVGLLTKKWMFSICPEHRRLISDVRCDFDQETHARAMKRFPASWHQYCMMETAKAWLWNATALWEVMVGQAHFRRGVVRAHCRYTNAGLWKEASFTNGGEGCRSIQRVSAGLKGL